MPTLLLDVVVDELLTLIAGFLPAHSVCAVRATCQRLLRFAGGELASARCQLVGSCIGPSFAFQLMRDAPTRFDAAVLMQPIGLAVHSTEPGEVWQGLNHDASSHWYGGWAADMIRAGHANKAELQVRGG